MAARRFSGFIHPKAWALGVIHMSVLTFLRITGYGLIPIAMAWAGLHLAAMAFDNPEERRRWRVAFILLAVFGIGIVTIVEVKIDVEHKAEVEQQTTLSTHLSSQVDKLVDIQTRVSATKPYPIVVDLNVLKQQLKDERERTQIALDSIERRLSQIGQIHKDDLRTRTLQSSRDLLAFLYQHPCRFDFDLARSNQDFALQLASECNTRMRDEYYKTYQRPALQILDEIQKRGLDISNVRSHAESGWNSVVLERLAVELSQLAEKLPKDN